MANQKKGAVAPESDRDAYYARVAREHMAPLWERLPRLLTGEPQVASKPWRWRFNDLRETLLESADLITAEEAERRVLILENPGLTGESKITETLYGGLQLITPGEVAPAHRHSPAALRFIIEGSGAYTAVGGEKAFMEPGDFIVTPAWAWHDHGHEGDEPVVWLDILDLPLIANLGAVFTEHYGDNRYPETKPPKDSLYRYGMNMVPEGYERQSSYSPIFSYPYGRSREALDQLKKHGPLDLCHGLRMEYIDPTTGGPAMPTISTFIQLLPQGFQGTRYRSSEGTVFSVIEGRGRFKIDIGDETQTFTFQPRDILVIPCWYRYAIEAESESVIFSASDRVVQEKCGVWREWREDVSSAA